MESAHTKVTALSQTELTLGLLDQGEPVTEVTLGVAEIDSLIASLAHLRRSMMPQIPTTLPEGNYSGAPVDPAWSLNLLSDGARALFLRHIGLGWLMFVFGREEATNLGRALLGQSTPEIAQPSPSILRH